MKRANLGCGSVQPEGWTNLDANVGIEGYAETFGFVDVASSSFPAMFEHNEYLRDYDYIVTNHMLSDIGHHDLVPALSNIRSMLKPGGVLRILVPDILRAVEALMTEDEDWFPQDERTGGIDAKFCTFVPWFGESKSVFTYGYLLELLRLAGFSDVSLPLECGHTKFGMTAGITELDDRCREALIVEALNS